MRMLMLVLALALLIPACGAADSTDDGTKKPAPTRPETPIDPDAETETVLLTVEGMT